MKISSKIRSRWAVLAVCLILVAAPLCARAVNEWKATFAALSDQELQEAYQCRFVKHIGQRTQWGKANGGVS